MKGVVQEVNEQNAVLVEEIEAVEAPDAATVLGYGALVFASLGTVGGIILTIGLLC